MPSLLACYESQISLLTSLAQSRHGAASLADAGIFQSIQASHLFAIDPDLGIGTPYILSPSSLLLAEGYLLTDTSPSIAMDNPSALQNYHLLLLSLTRLLTSVVVSRGPQNQQSIAQARSFLAENRALVVAMFKRSAKIGQVGMTSVGGRGPGEGEDDQMDGIVEELVELFTVLVTVTGFVEFEEERDGSGGGGGGRGMGRGGFS